MEATCCKKPFGERFFGLVSAEDHAAQTGMLSQVERRFASRQRLKPHTETMRPSITRERRELAAAGDQDAGRSADQLGRKERQAEIPIGILAGPERLGGIAWLLLGFQVRFEVV